MLSGKGSFDGICTTRKWFIFGGINFNGMYFVDIDLSPTELFSQK